MDAITIINRLQEKGERITLPRRLVIEMLGQFHKHQTIKDIQQHINDTNANHPLSETTIYRVLQWLKEMEIVCQTDMGQDGIVYALMNNSYHHHLICLACGNTMTIEDTLFTHIRKQLQTEYGFEARIEHMAIYGHCKICQENIG